MNVLRTAAGMAYVEAGRGSPVILIHGALSDWRFWAHQIEALSQAHRVIAVSLRGFHPDVVAPDGVSAATQVGDLVALIESLDRKPVLVGHSRGGRLAVEVAAQCGERLAGLVLHEPGGVATPEFFDPPAPVAQPGLVDAVRQRLAEADPIKALRTYVDGGHGAGVWDGLPAELRAVFLSNTHTFALIFQDRSVPLSRERAQHVRAPTLLMGGSRSPPVFARTIDVLSRAIPQSETLVIEGADHFAPMKMARDFTSRLVRHLSAF